MIDKKEKKFFQNKIYKNQLNSFEENYFKKLLNYYVKDTYKSYLINKLFNYFFPDLNEEKFCNNFYLTEKEIKIMSNNGMVFGGHTISHRVISKLSKRRCTKVNPVLILLIISVLSKLFHILMEVFIPLIFMQRSFWKNKM